MLSDHNIPILPSGPGRGPTHKRVTSRWPNIRATKRSGTATDTTRIEAKADATPRFRLSMAWNMPTVIVAQGPLYRITVELSSEATLTQVRIAPETIPARRRRTATRTNVWPGGTPRLMEASSMAGSSWWSRATVLRTLNGSIRVV